MNIQWENVKWELDFIRNRLDWETGLFMTGGLIRALVSRKEKLFQG